MNNNDFIGALGALSNQFNELSNTLLAERINKDNLTLQQRAQNIEIMLAHEAQEFQKQESELAFERNKEMWNLQNEYNSPAAQMKRYQDAGLNPNLVYGQGTPGNAQNSPTYNPAQAVKAKAINPAQMIAPRFDFNPLEAYYMIAQTNQVNAQTRSIEQTNSINEATKQSKILQELYTAQYKKGMITAQEYENKIKEIAYNVENALQNDRINQGQYQSESMRLNNEKMLGEIYMMVQQYGHNEVKNTLYKLGLDGDDPIGMIIRLGSRGALNENFLEELKKGLNNPNSEKVIKNGRFVVPKY